MESGIRFHTTKFSRVKNDLPSPFAMKLRKYIRTKRLEHIGQVGKDRVIDFKFGSGEATNHILLELYAIGNIVLTDGNYEILALLRSHQFDEEIAVQIGNIYPIAFTTQDIDSKLSIIPSSREFLDLLIAKENEWNMKQSNDDEVQDVQKQNKKQSQKKKQKLTLKQFLLMKDCHLSHFGPEILDHCIVLSGLKPSKRISELIEEIRNDNMILMKLFDSLLEAPNILHVLDVPGQRGYIICKNELNNKDTVASDMNIISEVKDVTDINMNTNTNTNTLEYIEFIPYLFKQHDSSMNISFNSFDEAVDEYFCKVSC